MSAQSKSGYDVGQRMEQVNGKPQRIEQIRIDELDDEGKEMIDRIRASAGASDNGKAPDYFLLVVRHKELFRSQLAMGMTLYGGKIPARERELAVLRNAWLCGAPYEWGEHVDISKRCGVTDEEVERATVGSSAPGWSEHERAIIKGVEEIVEDKMMSDETWDILARTWDDVQMMEFPALVGQYMATAVFQNSLRVRLAPDNPGLGYR